MAKGKSRRSGRRPTTRSRRKNTLLNKLIRAWDFSHYVALVLVLIGIVGLGYLFTDASFRAMPPRIEGANYLKAEQISQQAHISGKNIYTIDPGAISQRLITFVPQIESAKVRLGLPNRVVIQVDERQPVLMYSRSDQLLWADEKGYLFPQQETAIELPILVDEDGTASPDGKHLNPAIWPAIQEISATIPGMKEFHYRDVYGLFFISPEGWRVYLGDGKNLQSKLAMWHAVRQQLLQENRPIQIVDLRYDRVYIQ